MQIQAGMQMETESQDQDAISVTRGDGMHGSTRMQKRILFHMFLSFTLGTWKYQRINAKNIGILHTDTQRSYVHTCVLTGYPYTCKHACMHFRIEASPYCLFCRILAPQIVHGWVFLGTRDRVWMRACKDAECVCGACMHPLITCGCRRDPPTPHVRLCGASYPIG